MKVDMPLNNETETDCNLYYIFNYPLQFLNLHSYIKYSYLIQIICAQFDSFEDSYLILMIYIDYVLK